jgi:uncharacterized membrane protein YhaH (DUF805 family)
MAASSSGELSSAFASIGRVSPIRALLVTALAVVLFKLVGVALDRGDTVAYVLAGTVAGVTLAKLLAEWGRRFHDTGLAAPVGFVIVVAALIPALALQTSDLRQEHPALFTASWAFFFLVLALLLLRPGRRAENRFGPAPARPLEYVRPMAASSSRRGQIWAIVAAVGGALIGYTLIDLSHGMQEAQEETWRYVQQQEGAR